MPAPTNSQTTKWADGIRGIASLLVVTAHLARSLAPFLLNPTMGEKSPPVLLQLPFLRCLVMGRASVAIFAIISGYVNALKPTRQSRAGQIEASLDAIAKSAFRRTGRFIAPVVIATLLSWLACQFGAYKLAKVVDSQWIRDSSPPASATFAGAFRDLFRNLVTTWTSGGNIYDPIQWTMTYLLRGSMLVYLALFATVYVKPKFRVAIYAGMVGYYWWIGDSVIGINVYAGLVMAELTYYPEVQEFADSRRVLTPLVTSTMILLGLVAISYPEEHPEWAVWSTKMLKIGHYIFPANSEYARFYPGMGAQLICYGVMFNKTARAIFSSSWPCFFGKVSFAVYLIHAPLIRTAFTWGLYGMSTRPPSPGKDKEGHQLPQPWVPMGSRWVAVVLIPLYYVALYRLALLWVAHVDPLCGRITNWVEERIFKNDNQVEKSATLA